MDHIIFNFLFIFIMERKSFKLSTYKKAEVIETAKGLAILLAVALLVNGFLTGILIELMR